MQLQVFILYYALLLVEQKVNGPSFHHRGRRVLHLILDLTVLPRHCLSPRGAVILPLQLTFVALVVVATVSGGVVRYAMHNLAVVRHCLA